MQRTTAIRRNGPSFIGTESKRGRGVRQQRDCLRFRGSTYSLSLNDPTAPAALQQALTLSATGMGHSLHCRELALLLLCDFRGVFSIELGRELRDALFYST